MNLTWLLHRVWTPACITVTELPLCSLLQRICQPSRGSVLSTKGEHKSQLNYYSTHEIDFCEKNRRGKDESSPSYQTNKKTSSQPFEMNFHGAPSRLQAGWHGVNISSVLELRCKVQPRGRNKGNKRFTFQHWGSNTGAGGTPWGRKNSKLSLSLTCPSPTRLSQDWERTV